MQINKTQCLLFGSTVYLCWYTHMHVTQQLFVIYLSICHLSTYLTVKYEQLRRWYELKSQGIREGKTLSLVGYKGKMTFKLFWGMSGILSGRKKGLLDWENSKRKYREEWKCTACL